MTRVSLVSAALAVAAGCSDPKPATRPVPAPGATTELEPASADGEAEDGKDGKDGQDGAAKPGDEGDPAGSGSEAGAAAANAPAEETLAGQDFIADARVLYRVVACAGDANVPDHLHAPAVERHCAALQKRKERYRDKYATDAKEFIAGLRPPGLPDVVVYPFGGGDLISALVAYPDAREITTLSLEHGGDPRRIRDLTRTQLRDSLEAISVEIGGMLSVSNNTSANLSSAHTNLLPAQLSSFLIALAVHGFEPVSVRYFRIEDDGSLHYYTAAEIAENDDETAKQLKHDWQRPNFSPAFSHVELRFRQAGTADAPVRIHRHIAANLADRQLAKSPGVMAHLEKKGRISAMTKAASYLLWRGDFSTIRDYLLAHMEFMISDSTGIPPRIARKAGMVQETYGRFESAFLEGAPEKISEQFRELWSKQKYRRLEFRFGYVDSELRAHLLITKPAKPRGAGASGSK